MQPLTAMTNTIPYDTTRDTPLPDCLPHTSTQCSHYDIRMLRNTHMIPLLFFFPGPACRPTP